MRKRLAFLTSIIYMMMLFAVYCSAESRPIYIGDLIQLEIPKSTADETEIREAFVDFEIVDIDEAEDSFIVTFRSFETGSKTLVLNGQEIIIEVASILEEEPMDNLYEGDFTLEKEGLNLHWNIYFYVFLFVTLIGLFIILVKVIKKKKKVSRTAKEIYIDYIGLLDSESSNYLHQLNACFIEYLEEKLQVQLKTLNGNQIMNVLVNITERYKELPLVNWSEKMEYYKFSGQEVPKELKSELTQAVYNMIDTVETIHLAIHEPDNIDNMTANITTNITALSEVAEVENEKSEVKL